VMVFTFAGSTHTKYMNYLLEMIVDLELESNPFLKDASLLSMVLNLDGSQSGTTTTVLTMYVRNIWSRNIKDIYELKTDFRAGVGLSKRSAKHPKPHERPEVKTLLAENRSTQLSKRRPGRTYNDGRNVDDLRKGIKHLGEGTLSKWAKRTSNTRIRYFVHES
ncbi:hypothetical protein B0H13DRAFT_1455250, partial [Mycena leptocephala]